MNNDKYFETETPEILTIKGNELRLFRENKRLAVSRPRWNDSEGVEKIGKTVTINLESNRGNAELIELFETVIEILKEGVDDADST